MDVRLIIHQPEGNRVEEVATFLGELPPAGKDSPTSEQQRADEAARLSRELEKQAARTRQLEKTVEDMRTQIQKQQKQRMANQSPESVKK